VELRTILADPVARAHFLSDAGDLESAQLHIRPAEKKEAGNGGVLAELDAAVEAMKNVPWTTLQSLKGDPDVMKKIEDAENLLKSLRSALK
jgi:ParB family transcriptional regulator, chromosome partitioning protein